MFYYHNIIKTLKETKKIPGTADNPLQSPGTNTVKNRLKSYRSLSYPFLFFKTFQGWVLNTQFRLKIVFTGIG